MNLLPLWTPIVNPTKSGVIIDDLDHVFITFFFYRIPEQGQHDFVTYNEQKVVF
jgi:hypothetical protein